MTKQGSLAVCIVVAACQVASNSSAGEGKSQEASTSSEIRLPERSQSKPPAVMPIAGYAVDARELLEPAPAANISQSFAKKLSASTFVPGRAYRLTFTARRIGEGEASVGIKFREAGNATFRSFLRQIAVGPARQYQLEFAAPVYTGKAELAVDVQGAGVALEGLSLHMRSALPRTVPVASWAGSFVPEGYALVFNDEFDGPELDRSKWFTRYIYSSETLDHLNKENQRYTDHGNHVISGGVLSLTAARLKLSQPSGANYESGMIRSDFTLRYGFLEARVRMPGGLGVWPAFWLNSDVSDAGHLSWPPEIDIFEFVNNGKDDKVNAIHFSTTETPGEKQHFLYTHPRFDTRFKDYFAPFNFNEGWHTIGAEWTPSEVTLFVDGLKIATTTFQWTYAEGSLAGPAHILLNLAIGDQWAGRYGIDDSAFPQALAVDWVRVYQKPPRAK